MRKRYRVMLLAALVAALVVPVGFALSVDSTPVATEVVYSTVASSSVLPAWSTHDDESLVHLRHSRKDIVWVEAPRGRALQMNAGAAFARGEWLLFLHADTRLPSGWTATIAAATSDRRVVAGCFRFALDTRSPI